MTEQSKNVCVFCGNAGVKFTKEHVFSDWINKVTGLSSILALNFDQDCVRREWKMKKLDHTVRVVCEHCNSGWMSRELEVPAKRLLTPMLLGQPQHANLGHERQRLIAAWSLKTALMIEQTSPRDLVFPPSDYKHLINHREPASGTLVFLSTHEPPTGEHGLLVATSKRTDVRSLIRNTSDDLLPQDFYAPYRAAVAMFAVQHLVITVLSHNFPDPMDVETRPSRPGLEYEDYFQQAWPVRHRRLRWPLRSLKEVGGFEGIFDAWRGVG
jgi:hypothetical protein